MRPFQIAAVALAFSSMNSAMAQERIRISSDWGNVTAELFDNDATRSLVRMLPLTIHMQDHLRQEKTGNLPSPLPEVPRQLDFAVGTLGLWGPDHFVIYYRKGRVPQPGIAILGNVTGNVSVFDLGRSNSRRLGLAETHEQPHLAIGDVATGQGAVPHRDEEPLHIRPAATASQRAPSGGTPFVGFATSVGLRPPALTHPATLSHPD